MVSAVQERVRQGVQWEMPGRKGLGEVSLKKSLENMWRNQRTTYPLTGGGGQGG